MNWENYGNDAGGSRFVALDQINRDNVHKQKKLGALEQVILQRVAVMVPKIK